MRDLAQAMAWQRHTHRAPGNRRRLAGTGFALPGTLADRMAHCGHPVYRCHVGSLATARPLI